MVAGFSYRVKQIVVLINVSSPGSIVLAYGRPGHVVNSIMGYGYLLGHRQKDSRCLFYNSAYVVHKVIIYDALGGIIRGFGADLFVIATGYMIVPVGRIPYRIRTTHHNHTGFPGVLKNTVGEAERKNVLDRFFSKIVIDSIDLIFAKYALNRAIKLLRRRQIGPERFFYHEAAKSVVIVREASCAELLDR